MLCFFFCFTKIEEEIGALFDFMQHVYGLFGFEFHLELSTRPEKYLGTIEVWNKAEEVCELPDLVTITQSQHSNLNKHWRDNILENGN